jgi:hypothetical protein
MKHRKIILENDADLVLDRAKVILASTTINADIKRMIDKLGKLSTGTVMGISSNTSAAFGAAVASSFVKNITEQLNSCISQLQASSEAIDAELQKLDDITKGKTDLSSDVGVAHADPIDNSDAQEPTPDVQMQDDSSTDDTISTDADSTEIADEDDTDDSEVSDNELDDMFGAQPDPALLKQKKQKDSTKEATKESANIILAGAFKKLL